MRENGTRAILHDGQIAFGCFLRYPDAGVAELLALQSFNFLIFDGEHGTIEPHHCEEMVRAAELRGATPIVRVPTNAPHTILRFLDTGAQGVQVPLVRSSSDAQAAVRASKYWPAGARGLAGVRAADYGQGPSLAEYVTQANDETLVVAQIETQEALDNIHEIAAVPGIDVLFVGPTDLSQALGVPGRTNEPVVREAFDAVAQAVHGSGAVLGALVRDEADAKAWIERGARYMAVTVEAIVASRSRQFLATLRT